MSAVRAITTGDGKVTLHWQGIQIGPISIGEGRRLQRDLDGTLAFAKHQLDTNGNPQDIEAEAASLRDLYAGSLDYGQRA